MGTMRKMTVSCDGHYRAEAYVDESEDWNGALLPYFPKSEAVKVLEQFVALREFSEVSAWRYEEAGDCFYYYDENQNIECCVCGEELDTEDGKQTGYGIGYSVYSWTEDAGQWD